VLLLLGKLRLEITRGLVVIYSRLNNCSPSCNLTKMKVKEKKLRHASTRSKSKRERNGKRIVKARKQRDER